MLGQSNGAGRMSPGGIGEGDSTFHIEAGVEGADFTSTGHDSFESAYNRFYHRENHGG